MNETIDLSIQAGLQKFADITSETLQPSLAAITSKEVNIELETVFKCDVAELVAGYEDKTHIVAKEENTNSEIGAIVATTNITAIADLMLAGDGEGKDELDGEVLDAVKELSSQLLGALNVPLEGEFSKKFSIKVADVTTVSQTANFEASDYIGFNFKIFLGEKVMNIRFYIDEAFSNYIVAATDNSLSSDETSALNNMMNSVYSTQQPTDNLTVSTQNLDLLLDIDIPISVRMGTTKLFLKDILGLGPGNIVELEQNAGEPIELAVNDKVVARGEVVIIDGYFGFRIKEIISKAERLKKLKD